MNLQSISPVDAKRLVDQGAILVDIREADEYAREHIPGARHAALSQLNQADISAYRGKTLVFHCRSGARTTNNQDRLASLVGDACRILQLEGGLDGWRNAGLPTLIDRRQPIELQRQVQIAAGGLVLIGILLGLIVSPWFLAVSLFVGAGLMFAGITGYCGMARLLQRAPWNVAAAR
jgi:rhodanese-related sulfurtransferase